MDTSRRSILVVDDDPDMRDLLLHHLSRAGYDVRVAQDALAARERIVERAPDLIVADINMPEESGVEFVASLREDAAYSRIPVIYLTNLEENTELAVKTLGFPLLSKPLVAPELLAMVKRQLSPGARACSSPSCA